MSNVARIAAAIALILSACGPSSRNGPGDDDTGDDSGGGGGGGGTDGGGGGSSCASETVTAEQIPLDMYVMLDQSSSMTDTVAGGGDKWEAVTSALDSFVMQSGLDGIAMGLGYFAVGAASASCPLTCTSDSDCGSACGPCDTIPIVNIQVCAGAANDLGGDSCNATDYATPAVGMAALPGVAPQITTSIAAHSPTTGTPTVQALEGALDYAKSWGTAHAGDAVVVVLATDGEPDDTCTPEDVPSVEGVAAGGVSGTPSVKTFVIGVGDDLTDLDGIAASGGTGSAFLVDTGSDVDMQFLAALNAIRHSVLGCVYQIPLPTNGQMLDYGEVNVVYTPGGSSTPETIPNVPNAAACPASGNAWYYDNPSSPTQIILCTPTCNTVEADTSGSVDIQLGCATVIQ